MESHCPCLVAALVLAAALVWPCGWCLRMVEVRIPTHTVLHQSARLECHFDLGDDVLYFVKWYKDEREIYRFVPSNNPPVVLLFSLPGVNVDIQNSSASQIVLRDVTLSSSGRYSCEICGEAPSFQTVDGHGDMLVVAPGAASSSGPNLTTTTSSSCLLPLILAWFVVRSSR